MNGENIWLRWRSMAGLDHHQEVMLSRLEQRVRRDGDQAVLTDDQALVMKLVAMLDTVAAEVPPIPFAYGAAIMDS